jgi:hypothetical protein
MIPSYKQTLVILLLHGRYRKHASSRRDVFTAPLTYIVHETDHIENTSSVIRIVVARFTKNRVPIFGTYILSRCLAMVQYVTVYCAVNMNILAQRIGPFQMVP